MPVAGFAIAGDIVDEQEFIPGTALMTAAG
jgi:hypothetical protein